MYEAHFRLRHNPFNRNVPGYVYQSPALTEALAHFGYALENRETFLLLTGEVGIGKTTAIQALVRQLPPQTRVSVVNHTSLTPKELLVEISRSFGVDCPRSESKAGIVRRLEASLSRERLGGAQALLVLDEAHLLSAAALEEIRLLSNLELEGAKLVPICLVGQPELERRLRQSKLRSLRQRVSVRYRLSPLTVEETCDYLEHRLKAAGSERPAEVFSAEASRAVHRITQGIPREINVVAGLAMLSAYSEDAPQVGLPHVVSVVREYGYEGLRPQDGVKTPSRRAADALPLFPSSAARSKSRTSAP